MAEDFTIEDATPEDLDKPDCSSLPDPEGYDPADDPENAEDAVVEPS